MAATGAAQGGAARAGARQDDGGIGARLAAAAGGGRVVRDAPLAPLTTFRVGGRADWLVEAAAAPAVAALIAAARRLRLPVTLLGGGSNVLVSDAGVRGVVIRLRPGAVTETAPGRVRAEAGVTLNGLIRWMIRRGHAGLEAWAGTPGTVGGAVRGNAHFGGRLIGGLVTAVGMAGPDGRIVRVPAADLGFDGGGSRLARTGEAAVWAEFAVAPGRPADLREAARASLRFRKRTQPLAAPSAGCIFRNPEGGGLPDAPRTAGALIDAAGLKGRTIGGACVSPIHANFIVTGPGASARDVRSLIDRCRTDVAARFGVTLTPEVVFLGAFGPAA